VKTAVFFYLDIAKMTENNRLKWNNLQKTENEN